MSRVRLMFGQSRSKSRTRRFISSPIAARSSVSRSLNSYIAECCDGSTALQNRHAFCAPNDFAADASAAAGQLLTTPDWGWGNTNAPLAAPEHFAEWTFDATANTNYRVWLRLRGAGDSKWNESVWVQFSDAVNAAGSRLYPVATTEGLLVNLENCSGCGVSGWGWQNRGYWLADTGEVRFGHSGPQTIRIQIREDGVQLDQIVISPSRFLEAAPGPLKNDATIVSKP